jgi:hypothetical protein
VNKVTEDTFKAIKKATQDSCKGGGLLSSGPFRLLWEPESDGNRFSDLATLFDRSDLEDGYLREMSKEQDRKPFDAMRFQVQNDIVAPVHRDLAMRYSSRIHRILEETGRRKNICAKNGLISLMENGVNKFLATTERNR